MKSLSPVWLLPLLLFLSLLFDFMVTELIEVNCTEFAQATLRDNVILHCSLKPPQNASKLRVEWILNENYVHIYRNFVDNPYLQNESFKNRTSLFHGEMEKGNISLKLTNVTEKDAGNYSCSVPSLRINCYIDLTVNPVKEGFHGNTSQNYIDSGMIPIAIPIAIVIVIVIVIVVFRKCGILRTTPTFLCGRSGAKEDAPQSSEPPPTSVPLLPTTAAAGGGEQHSASANSKARHRPLGQRQERVDNSSQNSE